MTKKSMHNSRLGPTPKVRARLAAIEAGKMSDLAGEYQRAPTAIVAWEAILEIHSHEYSQLEDIDYPAWVKGYLGEVARRLFAHSKSELGPFLAEALSFKSKRQINQRREARAAYQAEVVTLHEKDHHGYGHYEQAYAAADKHLGHEVGAAKKLSKKFRTQKLGEKAKRKVPYSEQGEG